MCHRVTCGSCGKPTFRGCGQHIEEVLASVPESQRCHCDSAQQRPAGGGMLAWLRNR